MPVISRFFGIIIYMYWRDHAPPHFHAKYAGEEVEIEIESGKVLGSMNRRALKMSPEWSEANKAELLSDWKLAEEQKELKEIKPLE